MQSLYWLTRNFDLRLIVLTRCSRAEKVGLRIVVVGRNVGVVIIRVDGSRSSLGFTLQPPRHFFLLPFFSFLFFLALLKSLWTATWHSSSSKI